MIYSVFCSIPSLMPAVIIHGTIYTVLIRIHQKKVTDLYSSKTT
jgi:hypothetical protein